MTPTLVDAIGARKRAAASFLRRATGGAGSVGPQAVRWKDFWSSHDGLERRCDKNPGSYSTTAGVPANWGQRSTAGVSGGARPDAAEVSRFSTSPYRQHAVPISTKIPITSGVVRLFSDSHCLVLVYLSFLVCHHPISCLQYLLCLDKGQGG